MSTTKFPDFLELSRIGKGLSGVKAHLPTKGVQIPTTYLRDSTVHHWGAPGLHIDVY
jgi:hypothetical protein